MSAVYLELSGESLPLAQAEAGAASEVLGGHVVGPLEGIESLLEVDLPASSGGELVTRIALAHRCLVEVRGTPDGLPIPSAPGLSAAFRPFRRPRGGERLQPVLGAARVWIASGGRIDLEHPDHRFWWIARPNGGGRWLEEVAPVDRRAVAARRISALPFRRPVGLDPRLARAAANLARVPPGGWVVDPFLGTGALLAEAAILGARVVGVDRDATMVQGALRNFAHLGVAAEALVVGDSGVVELDGPVRAFDAVLSDLPYGRASATGGEASDALARRVLPRWADRVRAGGRVVLVVPGGDDPLDLPWRRVVSVPVRVHRSLTREFRVYERRP